MKLLRLFADDDGESHFEDVEIPFEEADDYFKNTPPVLFSSFEAASEYGFERVPPGWVGSWHPAPQRVLAIYLSGELEIEASDGEFARLGPERFFSRRTQQARVIGIVSPALPSWRWFSSASQTRRPTTTHNGRS
ncbi:MAG: cupin domain-containing protein [Acidimicrobiia bacterium]